MLDIKFIRENAVLVQKAAKSKGVDVDVKKLLKIDKERTQLINQIEKLRQERNIKSKKIPENKGIPTRHSKELKNKLKELEEKLTGKESEWQVLMLSIPNPPAKDVKAGEDESKNEVLRKEGKPPKFDFIPKDHLELTEKNEFIDVKRGAKVSGTRFSYLKGPVAMLELALINYAFEVVTKEGFVPVFPPIMISDKSMKAMGYLEHGGDAETYHFEKDNLYIIGTSEQAIGPMHGGEIFEESELPKRYVAFSTCLRREAGSYGKDTKGILRQHQFDKVEMFSFVTPEMSDKEHEFFLTLEERITTGLGLSYQVVKMCSGDLGDPAARKYDIETWMPSQNKYRETHSTSTCTDFQTRRLNIKYRKPDGAKEFVHTVNGTAIAIGRMIIVILENYQQKDGSIKIPEALQKYTGFKEIK